MNPGDRPRSGVVKLLAVVVTAGVVTTLSVLADSDPAGAGELERFASCEAIADWGAQGIRELEAPMDGSTAPADDIGSGSTGGDGASAPSSGLGDEASATPAAAPQSAGAPTGGTTEADAPLARTGAAEAGDGTNVIVEGVDELDLIDLLDDDHALVSAASRLSIVDLVDHRVVANLTIPPGAEITYDRANALAWVVGADPSTGRLSVSRVLVDATTLTTGESWSSDGWLVDARRVGDRLYVVATDGYDHGTPEADGASIPFADGPVPCDQVLHPAGSSDPSATLIVELSATGPLEPVRATEVVGSGASIHVTTDAAYLATPLYGQTVETSFHRFDLATLQHTGSGRVEGTLLNEFAMSDHDGAFRVAVTVGGQRGFAIDAMPAPDIADGGAASSASTGGSGSPASALNEIVVFDTDGALDVAGRTPRFGHPGETLHGIRFAGPTAYAVTFLQTDPFFVVDLSNPAAPSIAGEVELPGFSSYLHPIGDGIVAGFGPDADGSIAVKLFDVSVPARPTVVDELDLGDESPIAWDHHAFVDLGDGRFAVPASSYRDVRPAGCTPAVQQGLSLDEQRLIARSDALFADAGPQGPDPAQIRALELERQRIYEGGCLYPTTATESSVVVVDTTGGRLQLVQRLGAVRTDTSAERAVVTSDGWALLAGNRWVVIDGAGAEVADVELGPAGLAHPTDVGAEGVGLLRG